jgi:hypothetical protein
METHKPYKQKTTILAQYKRFYEKNCVQEKNEIHDKKIDFGAPMDLETLYKMDHAIYFIYFS